MADSYVRPPLVPTEAPSRAWMVWRYRVVVLLLLVAVLVGTTLLFLSLSGVTAEDPGFGGLSRPQTGSAVLSAAR